MDERSLSSLILKMGRAAVPQNPELRPGGSGLPSLRRAPPLFSAQFFGQRQGAGDKARPDYRQNNEKLEKCVPGLANGFVVSFHVSQARARHGEPAKDFRWRLAPAMSPRTLLAAVTRAAKSAVYEKNCVARALPPHDQNPSAVKKRSVTIA